MKSFFAGRIRAVKYALAGIVFCIRYEINFRIQLIVAVLVVLAGSIAGLSGMEWLCVTACITVVLMAEAFNTAAEKLCDLYCCNQHPVIKIIKDVAAGAVLLAAAGSIVAGLIIFVPKFF
jgi:diacylglycerol kinase